MSTQRSTKDKTILVQLTVDIALYCLLLAYALYIIVKYLVMQGKSEIVNLTVFYVLVVILAVCKIGFLIVLILWPFNDPESLVYGLLFQITDNYAQVSSLIIGLLQIATMTELAIQVKLSAYQI